MGQSAGMAGTSLPPAGLSPGCQARSRGQIWWKTMATVLKSKTLSATPYVLALRRALAEGDGRKIAGFAIGELDIEIRAMRDAVWALIRRARCGGLALRMAHIADEFDVVRLTPAAGEALRLAVKSALGEHRIVLCGGGDALAHLRVTG